MTTAAAAERDQSSSPFNISAEHRRVVAVAGHRKEYEIELGGTVDMDNSMTRHYERVDIAFQPNLSLEIANTGSASVTNPRIVINDQRNWWTLESLLDEILAGARDDQEKALLIWDFVRKNRYHDRPLFVNDELHDPVRFLCVYGAGRGRVFPCTSNISDNPAEKLPFLGCRTREALRFITTKSMAVTNVVSRSADSLTT